ncbi:transposon Tf2-9 polyprotein [Trichonephila clavata]|uniref:RNA-directed DNA polymerase n=1 Tax=Trichonephila clavata TaxID=2740835 RepID=A0A8X6F450_TRICU|nr:transposon Tf2-9 polyprotein [Trichonephila clavata]
MDDARITGSNESSHFTALEEFFKKCREHGLKLNLNKSKFFQNEINFLGHRIDSKGLHKTNEKISAVVNAPVPENVHEVKSFLGLVNFYGKFCENLATIANPLNNLTKKNVRFLWSKDFQVAFEQIKKEICSPKVLVHYDPSLPLTLASDASPVVSFEFDIIFRKTIEHGNADFLSRLPKTSEELEVKDDITIFQMSQIEPLPVTSKELRQETGKDIELGPLLKALREGKDLQGREAQYTIEDGCIMYGKRVCIPKKF